VPGEATVQTRCEQLAGWDRPVSAVRFADARRCEALGRLGVHTVEDLLRHYPFRYLDLTAVVPLGRATPGSDVTVVGTVHSVKIKKPRPRLHITEVTLTDGTGTLVGVWFNQPYIAGRFREGERVALAGTVEMDYGLRRIRAPFFEKLDPQADPATAARVIPVHHATEGLSTAWIRRLVTEALAAYGDVPDFLPAEVRGRRGLTTLADALAQIHFPDSTDRAAEARGRLAYDELLLLQLGLLTRRHALVDSRAGVVHKTGGPLMVRLKETLPFTLTEDQERAATEILDDMASARPMNRMLLGDVGTGKTAVALLALAAAVDSGHQAAMMAPTEVLAAQYAQKLGPMLDEALVPWALLTGSTPAARRREVLRALADGSLSIVFGTHALLQPDVEYGDLSLAIVDEQHRFGVEQRLGLRRKGAAPDLLVMTATPIPRSLALTIYGDLDTSYLRQRPGGRDPAEHITTEHYPKSARGRAYERIRAAVRAGHQAYVVCPLVDESEVEPGGPAPDAAAELKAATAEAGKLRRLFPELRVGLLTGQMRPAEKTSAMDDFRAGRTDVLVATTVIEVGVDVAGATVMLVEDAERFGLAQLHQLRGRIGRGEHPGEFILLADARSPEGRRRIEAICSTNDGFALAEEDLRLRGEGQVLGQRQHGLPELRLASPVRDAHLLARAREDAAAIVATDPELSAPEHGPLGREARRRFGRDWEWVSSG
jgi:ATP-dependent DNA helicase RecG